MSKLKLGKMTGKEVAEWLGISYKGTYQKNVNKQLEKLKDFCKFEKIRGGINVTSIYIEEYDKNLSKKNNLKYLDSLKRHNFLVTVSGTAEEQEISAYHCTKSRNLLFGDKPKQVKESSSGILGTRNMVWAIKLKGLNNYRYMTEEEEQLFDNLITLVYSNATPEQIKTKELIKQYCLERDMSAREMENILTVRGANFFFEVIEKFRKQTGLRVVCATKHECGQNFTLNETQQKYREELNNFLEEDCGNLE